MTRVRLSVVAAVLFMGGHAAWAAPKKARPAKEISAPAPAKNEIAGLKGDFKWGMSTDEVANKVAERVEATFKERLQKSANDPTENDQVRKQMQDEITRAKKNLVRFDGQKTGYDVSIIDEEFAHNSGESMLIAKEDNGTRYFFFSDGRLYKMFIAFDKETLQGKSFEEFGQLMQARFGKAKEIRVDQKTKAGVQSKLDHFEWGAKSGDGLRLVDRSEFYDVYCLVVYDSSVEGRIAQMHKDRRKVTDRQDSLVEAVTGPGSGSKADSNEDVIERVTGKRLPPINQQPSNIRVPSPSESGAAAPAAEPPAKKSKASKKSDKGKESDGLQL